MPMWRTGEATSVMPWSSAWRRILSAFLPPPCTSSVAPYSSQMPSTYSMSSRELVLGHELSSQPPTSVVSVSLPSLKAPAPPQPQVMSQGSQPLQTPVLRAGQARRLMSGPRSTRSDASAVAPHQLERGEDAGGPGADDDHVEMRACNVHSRLRGGVREKG